MDCSDEAPPSPRLVARRVSLCSSSSVDVVSRGTDRSTFPFKLYEMLEYASDHGLASIVWAHDGEAFEIIDADALMDDVAPLFFKQSKFRSFTRQLNIWGFNRVEDSKIGWRHDNFIRGDVDGIALIKRIEIKGRSTTSKQGKRSRRTSTASKESYSSTTAPDLTASFCSVSESEVSSVSSNSAELPLEVLMAKLSSSTVPSDAEPYHETSQDAQQQFGVSGSGLLSVPSQVLYNPATSSEYSQYTPAFLAQTTSSLIQPIDRIIIGQSMTFGGPPSSDSNQHAQMTETFEEEDAFDVAIRELFS